MNYRDRTYIEDRLLAPCTDAVDACVKLREVGEGERAEELMKAIQGFTDVCRDIRHELFFTDLPRRLK